MKRRWAIPFKLGVLARAAPGSHLQKRCASHGFNFWVTPLATSKKDSAPAEDPLQASFGGSGSTAQLFVFTWPLTFLSLKIRRLPLWMVFFTGLTRAAEGFSIEWKTGAKHIRGSDLCGWACVKWPLQPCRTPGHPVRVGCCKNKFHDVASRACWMLQDNKER